MSKETNHVVYLPMIKTYLREPHWAIINDKYDFSLDSFTLREELELDIQTINNRFEFITASHRNFLNRGVMKKEKNNFDRYILIYAVLTSIAFFLSIFIDEFTCKNYEIGTNFTTSFCNVFNVILSIQNMYYLWHISITSIIIWLICKLILYVIKTIESGKQYFYFLDQFEIAGNEECEKMNKIYLPKGIRFSYEKVKTRIEGASGLGRIFEDGIYTLKRKKTFILRIQKCDITIVNPNSCVISIFRPNI